MKIITPFVVLITLFIMVVSCKTIIPEANSIIRKPVEIATAEGFSIGIYDYEGFSNFLEADNDTTYVLNFWATWCRPCVAELPYFQQLIREHEGQKVRFIFVSLDAEEKVTTKLIPFLKERQLKGEQILLKQKGMTNWIPKINKDWTGSLPATLIYKKGKRGFYEQSFEYEELKLLLQQFL